MKTKLITLFVLFTLLFSLEGLAQPAAKNSSSNQQNTKAAAQKPSGTAKNHAKMSKANKQQSAQKQSTASQKQSTVSQKQSTVTTKTKKLSNSKLLIQQFSYSGLLLEFRYINQILSGIKITNTSQDVLQVNTCHTHFVLGPQDFILINPPKVAFLQLGVGPYNSMQTLGETLFPNRFNDLSIYQMPNKQNNSVDLSGVFELKDSAGRRLNPRE